MKKLLYAVSALSLMFMSSQTFATPNLDYNDDQKDQITHGLRERGNTEQQIADFFKALSVVQTTLSSNLLETTPTPISIPDPTSQATGASTPVPEPVSDPAPEAIVVSTPAPEPVSDPASQATVVSTLVPEPTIEEAVQKAVVQKVTVPMLSLKDRSPKNYNNHNNFMIVYHYFHNEMNKTGSMKEDFALHIWISKDEENRLYYPDRWVNFIKDPFGLGHRVRDVNMASEAVQIQNLHALYYKKMDEEYNIQIEDLRAIGSKDTRTEAEIIQSMSIPAELNETQKTIDNLSNLLRGVKRVLKK